MSRIVFASMPALSPCHFYFLLVSLRLYCAAHQFDHVLFFCILCTWLARVAHFVCLCSRFVSSLAFPHLTCTCLVVIVPASKHCLLRACLCIASAVVAHSSFESQCRVLPVCRVSRSPRVPCLRAPFVILITFSNTPATTTMRTMRSITRRRAANRRRATSSSSRLNSNLNSDHRRRRYLHCESELQSAMLYFRCE